MKITKKGLQWHIILIIALIFLYSLLCWGQFIKSVGSIVIKKISAMHRVERTASLEEENGSIGNASSRGEERAEASFVSKVSVIDRLDAMIDKGETFWQEQMFQKALLTKGDTVTWLHITGELFSYNVLLGKENWLFYRGDNGTPIRDFEGTNQYSHEEMEEIFVAVKRLQDNLKSREVQFAVLVAPNKENVYAEYMPDTYTHSKVSRTDLLIRYLQERGIHVADPKGEILSLHSKYQLYYTYDTHWNQLGAYIGV